MDEERAHWLVGLARVIIPACGIVTWQLLLTQLSMGSSMNSDVMLLLGMLSFCIIGYLLDRDKRRYPIDFDDIDKKKK